MADLSNKLDILPCRRFLEEYVETEKDIEKIKNITRPARSGDSRIGSDDRVVAFDNILGESSLLLIVAGEFSDGCDFLK